MDKKIGFLPCIALLSTMTGCVSYVDEPQHARRHAPPPTLYVESEPQDDFVYYPQYQVYYSSNRRQYIYVKDRSWVTRPAPPRVSVDVLVASPSVRLNFHDDPAIHHAAVIRQYPQHWSPPEPEHGHEKEGRSDGKRNDRGDRR